MQKEKIYSDRKLRNDLKDIQIKCTKHFEFDELIKASLRQAM